MMSIRYLLRGVYRIIVFSCLISSLNLWAQHQNINLVEDGDRENPNRSTHILFLAKFYASFDGEGRDEIFLHHQTMLPEDPVPYGYSMPLFKKPIAFNKNLKTSLLDAKSEADIEKILTKAKDQMTFDQKLHFVSLMGEAFGENYDFKRAENRFNAKALSALDLLQALKEDRRAGVCRDISLAQAKFLTHLSIPNTFVIDYQTPRPGGHTTVITQDPNNPSQTYKFDYAEILTENTQSMLQPSLAQSGSHPDVGLHYRIFDADGYPVAQIPSALGTFYQELTQQKSEDPFLHSQENLVRVGISMPLEGEGTTLDGYVFTGKTSEGDPLTGVTIAAHPIQRQTAQASGTVVLSKLDLIRPSPLGEVLVDGAHLYSALKFALNTSEYQTPSLDLRAGAALNLEYAALASKTHVPDRRSFEKFSYEPNLETSAGIESTIHDQAQRTRFTQHLKTHMYIAPQQLSASRLDAITLAHNFTVVRNELRHQIKNTDGIAELTFALRNIGVNYSFKVGLESKDQRHGVMAGIEGPVQRSMPHFFPGGKQRCVIRGKTKLCEFDMFLEYEKNLDSKGEFLGAQFEKKF
ncbi:MAG: hypothetical protein HYY61_00635 [Deltaproteobacteria bacterium]|nr:hypothetical protein [Deltaproteobacteria bacterium]